MPQFAQRSTALELMDGEITDKNELFLNLKELEFINTLTGGPALVFATLLDLLKNYRDREVHIVDIGYGAGDMFVFLLQHAAQLPCKIRLTGVDLMPEAQEYALQMHPELSDAVTFVCADCNEWFAQGNAPDIVLASLFCHHLTDEQLVLFLKNVQQHTKIGLIINDLHRHWLAYYGIKVLTRWFSASRFTKNDAPLSVLRGFVRSEWEILLRKAGVIHATITWKWAFRYIIVLVK
jgi:2-polyprenyl-3-methyl-5-hydroxy-6-metoxy-1,4-benzoquinol methylase